MPGRGRPRLYADQAECQRAYRERQRTRLLELQQGVSNRPPSKAVRPPSRPARLQRAIDDLAALAGEYEEWLQNMPEQLQEGATGEKTTAMVDLLHEVLDTLSDAEPPKGYGRD